MTEQLPPSHQRPEGVDDLTVAAVGALTEALESVIRARGHLYSFHQLTGKADLGLDDAVEKLRKAGHDKLADEVATTLIGRNVNPGRWSFQVVEQYDDDYFDPFVALERQVRDELMDGKRHLYEAEMKQRRITPDEPGHELHPGEVEPKLP